MLTLAGLQFAGLAEGFQFHCRLVEFTLWRRDIELYDFFSGHASRVLYGDGSHISLAFLAYLRLGILEGGVAQTIAEGIAHALANGLIIAVAHVEAFFVFGFCHIGCCLLGLVVHLEFIPECDVAREVLVGWNVVDITGEGDGQFSAGIDLASQHIGNRVSGFHTGLPGQQDGIGVGLHFLRVDGTSHIQNHHHGFSCTMESLIGVLQQGLFVIIDIEVGKGAVAAFTAAAAYGDNRQVVVLCRKLIGVLS